MALINPMPVGSDPELDELVQQYDKESGFVPNTLFAMAHRLAIVKASQELHKAVRATYPGSRVTPELKGLLGHVASGAAGCRYCQAHTAYLTERRFGKPDRIAQVWEYRTSPLFTDAERAALDLAVGAGVTPNAVTPEMRATARRYWTDGELVEIVGVIAAMGFTNRWNDTVAPPMEDIARAYASERLKGHGWEVGRHADKTGRA